VGLEATTTVEFGGSRSTGKALLETSEIIFRGHFRLVIPFKEIETLSVADGVLAVRFGQGEARFDLGALAETWAGKIRNPRGRIAKLGVKPGAIVALVGEHEPHFRDEIAVSGAELRDGGGAALFDLIFFAADQSSDLERLSDLRVRLTSKGAIWVVSPKGKGAVLKDTDVMAAARVAGLVDTKVVGFSASHTALKLVIPVDRR
jgi:hypothetical protein